MGLLGSKSNIVQIIIFMMVTAISFFAAAGFVGGQARLSAPDNFEIISISGDTITLEWGTVAGAESYEVQYCERVTVSSCSIDGTSIWNTNGVIRSGPSTTTEAQITIPSFSSKEDYYFRVRAKNANISSKWTIIPCHPGNRVCSPIECSTVECIFNRIVDILSWVIGPIAVAMIIIGGIMYMTAGANPGNAEKGRKTIIYALLGFIIVLVAQFLPSVLSQIF